MPTKKIEKLLIANRGEIAVRIARTCKERDIVPVAVYSDADASSMHVRFAEEAYRIGPAPSSDSYLRFDAILGAARRSGADAIHPGYGFLSENAEFAQACSDAGIVFVGPSPEAIRTMGDKTAARALMRQADVPMAPGTQEAIDDVVEAARLAQEIGYPVLIKAAAGGGGKGMRIVDEPAEFAASFRQARGEAENAFGDGRVYIEKYLRNPRHIEIQVLADSYGNVVHLFERDCSVQRRHQKVVEEAPSAALRPDQRYAMGAAAVKAARACKYSGAGTVEFLLDEDGRYYFLEMNTRLQVEHPVTELITGRDLVADQIRIAEGEELGITQNDLHINGHAIECRVYAENPEAGFLPSPGPLYRHRAPSGPGVRVDAGVEEGDTIPIHYDPMISKVSVWAPTRNEALSRMDRALAEYDLSGVPTTIPFCRLVVQHPAFRSGQFSTSFVSEHYKPDELGESIRYPIEGAAIMATRVSGIREGATSLANDNGEQPSRWALRRTRKG